MPHRLIRCLPWHGLRHRSRCHFGDFVCFKFQHLFSLLLLDRSDFFFFLNSNTFEFCFLVDFRCLTGNQIRGTRKLVEHCSSWGLQKKRCESCRTHQGAAGGAGPDSIASYKTWRFMLKNHFPELRFRKVKLVDSKDVFKAELRHLRRLENTQSHSERRRFTQLVVMCDENSRIERMFYWEVLERASLLQSVFLSFIMGGADKQIHFAPRFRGLAKQRECCELKVVASIVIGHKVFLHVIPSHMPTGANLTCMLVDDVLSEIAKNGRMEQVKTGAPPFLLIWSTWLRVGYWSDSNLFETLLGGHTKTSTLFFCPYLQGRRFTLRLLRTLVGGGRWCRDKCCASWWWGCCG